MKNLQESLEKKGYAILESFFDESFCDKLRERAEKLVEDYDDTESRSIFSTLSHQHRRDQYFLDSCDKIHFFWEEDAFDKEGKLRYEKSNAINKIGHSLHVNDEYFRRLAESGKVKELIQATGYFKEPEICQSMYIFKQPKIGGAVLCHQDSTFIHTKPNKVLGFWLALEDATEQNGCLWGIPGEYKGEPEQLFTLKGKSCEYEPEKGPSFSTERATSLPVKKGSVILFDGLFPHFSHPNTSEKSRHAFTLHFIDKKNEYLASNWNQFKS